MCELSKLPNIGRVVEEQLNEVGINTYDELKNIGAEEAWLRIQKNDPSACINRLLALEGAIKKVKKINYLMREKKNLRTFIIYIKLQSELMFNYNL